MKAMNLQSQWSRYTGLCFSEFYRKFRKLCAPPMNRITSLDVGELWGYNGLALTIVACVSPRSLIVAYDVCGTREGIEHTFRSANEWQHSDQDEIPDGFHLVCAVGEDPVEGLVVRHLVPGDWAGIARWDPNCYPLPPNRLPLPQGWE
jgi:hypothetical protein